MGMALRGRQHAGRLAIGLAEVAIGGAGDQAAGGRGRLHGLEQRREGFRGQREVFAEGGEGAPIARLAGDDMEDDAGDQGFGFLVPMRLAGRTGFVIDQGVGQGACVLGHIEAVRVEGIEGIEGGRGFAGDGEGVEAKDQAELLAGAAGDPGIFALGVDADDGAVRGQQVRDDGSHPFAGSRWSHGEQMRRPVIAQQAHCLRIAADQQAGL